MKPRVLRVYEVNWQSTAEDIVSALRNTSAKIRSDQLILRTRFIDQPREDDANQYIWVLAIELYDDEENQNNGFVQFVQRLNELVQQGIILARTRPGLPPRFRPVS